MNIRPQLDQAAIHRLLTQHFGEIAHLTAISLGQTAQVYRFDTNARGFVLRISSTSLADRFAKERYIAEHFGSPALPIPAIVRIGEYEGFEYALSVEAAGSSLEMMPIDNIRPFIPSIIAVSDAMCRANIIETAGYGWIDRQGKGSHTRWADHLRQLTHEAPEGTFWGKWHQLFKTTFLERAFFDSMLAIMLDLLRFCPEDHYLVHGNFSLPNLIGHDGQITGIVDWADARYGDFVFDIASLALWYPLLAFSKKFTEHYQQQGLAVPHFEQRLRCYELYIGLDALRFFAKVDNEQMYYWVKDRLIELAI